MACAHSIIGDCRTCETVKAGTSFQLGKASDDDTRQYVSVSRQFGSALYPIKPWVVHTVCFAMGVDLGSKVEFDDQAEALEHGWQRLRKLREASS